jgi:hypothetical protein
MWKYLKDWNRDEKIDGSEIMFGEEKLCISKYKCLI